MKRKISVELFEEYEAVNFYTIRFDGEETEADKFFASIPDDVEFDFDYDVISRWIEKIGEKGALERYFRTEGKFKDGVGAIPLESCNLRIYVLRLNDKIAILGNGTIKDDDPYNEQAVETLQKIEKLLLSSLRRGKTVTYEKQLFGKLEFEI